MSLLRRSLMLVGISLAPAVLIAGGNAWFLRDARQDEVREAALQQALSASQDLDRLFESSRLLLTALAALPEIREADLAACNQFFQEIVADNPDYLNIATADAEGQILCSAIPPAPGITARGRPYFRAVETNDFALGEYTRGQTLPIEVLQIAYPLRDEAGEAEGVIWLALKLDALAESFQRRTLPAETALLVTDRQGTVLLSQPDRQWVGQALPEPLVALAASDNRVATVPWVDGRERIVGVVPLGGLPRDVAVLVGVDREAAFREIDRGTQRDALVIAAGVALAFAAAVWGSRHFLEAPIAALLRAAERWRAGDLTARVNLPVQTTEFGRLGRAFDDMAEALAAREQALRAAKADAESRAHQAEQAERRQAILLKEVDHRVKNSLQMVSSLLSLQAGAANDPATRRHLGEASARVQTIARMHQRLYQADQVETVAFGPYLRDLAADVAASLGEGGALHRVELSTCEASLPTDRAVPLALAINELLINAFKYAYPQGQPGIVRVACQQEDGALRIVVEDDGVGLAEDFDPAKSGRLGMTLIRALARQIGAAFAIERKQPGARFVLTVPLASG